MKKTILTLIFGLFLALTSYSQVKFHRVKIIGNTAKSVCDYYAGNITINGSTKVNFYGLSSKLEVGKLYFTNSNYYIVTLATDVFEQDRDEDWTVNTQPNPIDDYKCKKYIRLAKLGTTYTESNTNFCTNRVLEYVKANYYWTGNLLIGKVYFINNEYYKITSITNNSNQDADENWYGTHHSTSINFTCKRFHKLAKISNPCSNYYSRTIKVNLENIPSKLLVGRKYKINNTYYKVISSSDFQDQDADDDLFVNTITGPYACRSTNNDNKILKDENNITPLTISVYNILGKKVKEYTSESLKNVDTSGLKKGLYIIKSSEGSRKISIE